MGVFFVLNIKFLIIPKYLVEAEYINTHKVLCFTENQGASLNQSQSAFLMMACVTVCVFVCFPAWSVHQQSICVCTEPEL